MLYDTGPTMGASTAARRIVLPQLQAEAVGSLDLLMVSHDDDDHASGLGEVLAAHPSAHLVTSLQPHELLGRGRPSSGGEIRCEWGVGWAWNSVHFRVLYPFEDRRLESRSGNDDSCVLEVTDAAGRRLILAGDLSSEAEADWLSQQPWLGKPRGPLLFMAPHHGSRGSLSVDTLQVLEPGWVFAQSRFQGRFQHPHPEVIERLEARGIPFLRTDLHGALRLRWQGESLAVERASDQRRFWHLLRDPAPVHIPGDPPNLIRRRGAEEDR
jgi:competence protein ComEC